MKTLILIFICLLPLIPCQAADNQPPQEKQNQQQLEIEKYISRLHREMENYYASRLIEMKQRAEAEIRLLEIADKPVYACLAAQAEAAKTVLLIDDCRYQTQWDYYATATEKRQELKNEREPGIIFADDLRRSPKRFAEEQSRIAERKSKILAQLEWETMNLERQKQYTLTIGLAQLEKRLKEDLLKPQPPATYGLVTGIVYSKDKPSALINGKIVHKGDKINEIKIVKIGKDRVEFEKNGKNWEQKVGQKPQSFW